MIKICSCGKRETIQPFGDARTLEGPCSECRKKALSERFKRLIAESKAIPRITAVSIISKLRVR